MPACSRPRAFSTIAGLCLPALLLLTGPAHPDALPMWQLDSATNHVRILGSIHFLRPGRDTLPPAVIAAYADAEVLLMELDLDDLDPGATQELVQRLAIDPQQRTLEVLLGARDYRLAADKARLLDIDLALYQSFEPWMVAVNISQMELLKLGFDASSGVEQQLLTMATRDRKEVRGLETIGEQLAAMDELPMTAQRTFLLETLDDGADMKDEIDSMVTAWRNGDIRAMEAEFLDSVRDQPELYRRIVIERNRNWARQIAPLMRGREDYLVVVGTLHLVGPDSLIRLLEAAGHPARQVRAD
jgi:uncharacterized protein